MKKLILGSAVVATLFLGVGQASAQEAFTLGKPSVAGAATYGIFSGDGDVNPYGIGIGARGGYTLDSALYVGGAFDYFLGESEDSAGASATINTWLLQGEIGFDLGVGANMVLRPKLGVGLTSYSAEVCLDFGAGETCVDDSESYMSLAPGVALPIDLGGLFIAPEARYNIVFADDDVDANAIMLGAQIGATF